MAQLSYDEFLQQQKERQERQATRANQGERRNSVGFFRLENDQDTAIIRFTFDKPSDLSVFSTHALNIDGKFRKVNCIRNSFHDPISACPLCAANKPYKQSVYLTMVEYTKNDDGTVTASPKVWERATGFMQTLVSLYNEYGSLSNIVCKITRNGAKGSMQTTYTVIPANPAVYNEQNYPKDFSAFENFKVLGGPLADKTYDELADLAKEQLEVETPASARPEPQTYQTAYTTPPSGGPRRIEY